MTPPRSATPPTRAHDAGTARATHDRMTKRSNGVGGSRYLVHVASRAVPERTLCGRHSASVNVSGDATPREELCRACRARFALIGRMLGLP